MYNLKKYVFLFVCLLLCFSLSSCASQEAKNVINQIKSLKNITIDVKSGSQLEKVSEMYDALSPDDKKTVRNYNYLEEQYSLYYNSVAEDFDTRVVKAIDTIDNNSYDKLNKLVEEYESFPTAIRESINEFSHLTNAFEESKKIKADSVIEEIHNYQNGETDNILSLTREYADILNEEQIKDCLLSYGRWESVDEAEEKIKTYLKSPRSFYNYGGTVSTPSHQSDGTYRVTVSVEYGATNSFGAEVKNSATVYCYFMINSKSIAVSFVKTELDPITAWRFAN